MPGKSRFRPTITLQLNKDMQFLRLQFEQESPDENQSDLERVARSLGVLLADKLYANYSDRNLMMVATFLAIEALLDRLAYHDLKEADSSVNKAY